MFNCDFCSFWYQLSPLWICQSNSAIQCIIRISAVTLVVFNKSNKTLIFFQCMVKMINVSVRCSYCNSYAEEGRNNMITIFELCQTLTVQYHCATCHCSLLSSVDERVGISRAFACVKIVWENSFASKESFCSIFRDS